MRDRIYPETAQDVDEHRDRAVLVGIDRGRTDWPVEESIAELERLAHTAGAEIVGQLVQRLDRPHSRTFIGTGKAEELAALAKDTSATIIIFDDELTPSQQANLEDIVPGVKIVDRTALILDIFALHAVSREGKLQVELAQMEYLLPRLRGLWRHLERLGAGIGTRGPGESQLETDRRIARTKIRDLKRELKRVESERATQRKSRAASGVFRIALVGYTNAGKSTLLNALTGAGVLAEDMLFATLDSTTRRLALPHGRTVTLTDTVGFIHKLPHGLVDAFKSTLDEVNESDLLLHVTDASHPQREPQMSAVREVLQEIGASDSRSIVVFNKIDRLDEHDLTALKQRNPGAMFVSAASGQGIEDLIARIADEAARGDSTITVLVPYTRGDLVQTAHDEGQVVSEHHAPEGTRMVIRVPTALASQFEEFIDADAGDSA